MTKRIDDLVQGICETADHPLAVFLRQGVSESRPFLAFVETHATKIRKKARLAPDSEELTDLLAELAVASILARDRRFTVHYEPHRASGLRGPDFQVMSHTRTLFHVEVTRLRLAELAEADAPATALKLARALCDKIGQCPAGVANLLAVVAPAAATSDALVPAAIRLLESYSPSIPSAELRREGVRAFLSQRQRLSAIALCSFLADWRPLHVKLWRNPQAKHPLAPELANYLLHT